MRVRRKSSTSECHDELGFLIKSGPRVDIDHHAENIMVGLKFVLVLSCGREETWASDTHTLMSELYEDISLHMMTMSVVCCGINTPFSAARESSLAS